MAAVTAVIYPSGIGSPSITSLPTLIYAGWPQSSQLDADMRGLASGSGRIHVTLFPTGTQKLQQPYLGGYKPSAGNTLTREVRRQMGVIQVTVWADTPEHREATAPAIDSELAATDFFTLPDGSSARLRYQSTLFTDAMQKANLYRRDLMYTVEYATTQTVAAVPVIESGLNILVAIDAPDGTAVHAFTLTETTP